MSPTGADAALQQTPSVREPETTIGERSPGPIEALARAAVARPRRGGRRLKRRLQAPLRAIDAVYERLGAASAEVIKTSRAAGWLLDNHYILSRAVRLLRKEFPADFERRLPCLTEGALRGYALVYALAAEIAGSTSSHVDVDTASQAIREFQQTRPLSIAELWALPFLLRLAILEKLAVAVATVPSTSEASRDDGTAAGAPFPEEPVHIVSSCVRSLRGLETADWKAFFESVSETERVLREDPSSTYGQMDFATRDRYRKVVERLARRSPLSEERVAAEAVALARTGLGTRRRHVGYYLVDEGVPALEARIGHRAGLGRLRLAASPTALYLGGVALLTLLAESILAASLRSYGANFEIELVALAAALIPLSSVAVGLVNGAITRLYSPRALPKLDFDEGIPLGCQTMVAVPSLLGDAEEARSLAHALEIRFLANRDPHLHFALLTDFPDAAQATLPGDAELRETMRAHIRALNAKYSTSGDAPFHLFHRERTWSAGEGCWMGLERKRGKLAALNQVLTGANQAGFSLYEGNAAVLSSIRFVITLDADTALPRASARRLVATLAHPLNRPEFDPESGRIVAGYSVLQPRVEIDPLSADASWFSRLFSGDAGLDPYTRAVSDVYQDLFAEGVFVGKGAYDVEAFERSLSGRVPDAALLSHDLFEGIHGRAALVSDIVLLEDYPAHYLAYARRLHRWARGDWQLLPWLRRSVPLADDRRERTPLSLISRWKILDNLRRTLLAPSLIAFLIVGWTLLPGPPLLWTLLALLVPAVPGLADAGGNLISTVWSRVRSPWTDLGRALRALAGFWLFEVAFLAHQAALLCDAIGRTLLRLWFTRRHLLQWTPAAQTARRLAGGASQALVWREMAAAPALALGVALLLLVHPAAFYAAGPVLLLWLLSPAIAVLISRDARPAQEPPTREEARRLRILARRTWAFFEATVRPDDQWLPPDHLQEEPRGVIARRTSPTNIGLMQLATVSAYDFGYRGLLWTALRLKNTLDTMERMERYRGHWLNWYDTSNFQPLEPRYVSTVDSGNLAACLILLKRSCAEFSAAPVVREVAFEGLLDTLDVLEEATRQATAGEGATDAGLTDRLQAIRTTVEGVKSRPAGWGRAIDELLAGQLPAFERALVEHLDASATHLDGAALTELREWAGHVRSHLELLDREMDLFAPALSVSADPPPLFTAGPLTGELAAAWEALRSLPALPTLAALPDVATALAAGLARLDAAVQQSDASAADVARAREWVAKLTSASGIANHSARYLADVLQEIARRCETWVEEMDFSALYDGQRRLFHIGYDVSLSKLDANHYDLLASEARLASFVAIAKGDVREEHWLHLGRPVGKVHGARALLSWSGTMFEYLMPALLLREGEATLIGRSCRAAVEEQIRYATSRGVPWGISESGFAHLDAQQNYQYRAFGIPSLGFKRGLEDDLVVTPYASVLALRFAPREALANLERLETLGMGGRFGFYEAVDFTPSRVPPGAKQAVVRSFMAHHQGMILTALNNFLHDDAIARRFHREPLCETAELLLYERPPNQSPVEQTRPPQTASPSRPRRRLAVEPWAPALDGPIPQAYAISNGRYSVLTTDAGAVSSRWMNLVLTRWSSDPTAEEGGFRLYLREARGGEPWSLFRPSSTEQQRHASFHPHMVELRSRQRDISARELITIAPDADVEVRFLSLTNESQRRRRFTVASYGEVVLDEPVAARRHRAFSGLFVESEYLAERHALLFHRRSRAADDANPFLVHMLVLPASSAVPGSFDSARDSFVGRGNTLRAPAALRANGRLSGTIGTTLDPILCLSAELDLAPRETVQLAYVTIVAESKEAVLALADRYRSLSDLEWTQDRARERCERELAELEINPRALPTLARLLTLVLHPHPGLRAAPDVLARSTLGRSGLWKFAVSGDLPIVLVRIRDPENSALVSEVVQAQAFWRARGVAFDLVALNEQAVGYSAELDQRLLEAVARANAEGWLHRNGGVFLVRAEQATEADRTLLLTAARVVLDAGAGPLAAQLERVVHAASPLPPLVPTRAATASREAVARPADLVLDNGFGGFTPDGREYVIHLAAGAATPAPWVNVIANPGFGCVVSESGGGYVWAENSGENRLTPWRNDPVSDEPGDALYLRDEETGEVWSPTPQPAPAPNPHQIRHGAGYTVFLHDSHDFEQRVEMFVPPQDPLKIVQLRITNRAQRTRRLTATYYVQWILGTDRETTQQHVVSSFDPESEALMAQNPWNDDFGSRVAFAAASNKLHGFTADRAEFLGRRGRLAAPAALTRIGLAGAVGPGLDPCAALQVHLDFAPGETKTAHFMLGQESSAATATALVRRYRDAAAVASARRAIEAQWDEILGARSVKTPDAALDLMLNRWLLYQTLTSRLWGRTGFYQSSGAFGFRDQLQDTLALLHVRPNLCREHLLRCARHQFADGDVLHWWHPPAGAGLRTRCSDDLVWLPFATAAYVAATGDDTVLSEEVPFLHADGLGDGELERYGHFSAGDRPATLYRHCLRALDRALTSGAHGLPLFGTGDWNDGMNRVGAGGRGESVWLGWFLSMTLESFAAVCAGQGDPEQAQDLVRQAESLRRAIESSAWDGAWYRRGTYDDGDALGSAGRDECEIDSVAQSWAVLAGGDQGRARTAMASVVSRLVRRDDGLILLLTPPFDRSAQDPGYIKGYPPGVRENGGQYTHAAVWVVWALANLGLCDLAAKLFAGLLPTSHSATRAAAQLYRVEPYVLAADVYGARPHTGRGGWTWYTGSAGWAYRFGWEVLLGVRQEPSGWRFAPRIPEEWPGFAATLRDGTTTYEVEVTRSTGGDPAAVEVALDRVAQPGGVVPRLNDGGTHSVAIALGGMPLSSGT